MAENGSGADGAVEQGKAQVQEKAGQAAGKLQDTARQQVDQRSTQAGERASSLAGDLRSVGERLREDGNDGPAKVADQVAERAEGVGSYLADSDADRILSDVEDLGRRQPWLVLAGGMALGIAAARVLKASSSERYGSRASAQPQGTSSPQSFSPPSERATSELPAPVGAAGTS